MPVFQEKKHSAKHPWKSSNEDFKKRTSFEIGIRLYVGKVLNKSFVFVFVGKVVIWMRQIRTQHFYHVLKAWKYVGRSKSVKHPSVYDQNKNTYGYFFFTFW